MGGGVGVGVGLRMLTPQPVLVALPCYSRMCLARSSVPGTKHTGAQLSPSPRGLATQQGGELQAGDIVK